MSLGTFQPDRDPSTAWQCRRRRNGTAHQCQGLCARLKCVQGHTSHENMHALQSRPPQPSRAACARTNCRPAPGGCILPDHLTRPSSTAWFEVVPVVALSPAVQFCTGVSAGMNPISRRNLKPGSTRRYTGVQEGGRESTSGRLA